MNQEKSNTRVAAPCIVDAGIVVNKRDMQVLLAGLGPVRYIHTQDGKRQSEGEGYVLDVFADPQRATLVANHAIYLNVYSFDYLELKQTPQKGAYFDLIHHGRKLRLIPLSNALQDQASRNLDVATLESVVTQTLSSDWDFHIEDEEDFSY